MTQLNDILKLSLSERVLWVEAIWNSIASEKSSSYFKLTAEQQNFLNEESEDYKKNPGKGASWDVVKKRIKSGK